MTKNVLCRKVLEQLRLRGGSMKFRELVDRVGDDARAVFKNLFFLEEKGYLQLSTSYPPEAVYPQIHLVRLRRPGEELAADPARLDTVFPLSDAATDTRIHIPPDLNHTRALTFHQALELLPGRIRESMDGEERNTFLEKIESLLALPLINEPIRKP
jgi:hypothetical protein